MTYSPWGLLFRVPRSKYSASFRHGETLSSAHGCLIGFSARLAGPIFLSLSASRSMLRTERILADGLGGRQPPKPHEGAVDFLLEQIKLHPGEITLIGIAPETNLAAALARDPVTFKKLKRIVIMGGSVRRGYGDLGYAPDHGPNAEYNIAMDIPAAQAVFTSGVPLYVMPLDSTQLKLDEVSESCSSPRALT